ncbi:hypothetical protein WG66_004291 [Moniliophthora roreri]|uniref:Zn(2)-C6 fungal-type domain-containing protein n=1 Tax=Moniliophthora roreri TaxID=221103 RepID=A0A0W0EU25_MONRR|nr:hypothetical protein WG66_004291 [Moniliophthora roreri]
MSSHKTPSHRQFRTPLACTNCRRRKARCDPHPEGFSKPCQRCNKGGLLCEYLTADSSSGSRQQLTSTPQITLPSPPLRKLGFPEVLEPHQAPSQPDSTPPLSHSRNDSAPAYPQINTQHRAFPNHQSPVPFTLQHRSDYNTLLEVPAFGYPERYPPQPLFISQPAVSQSYQPPSAYTSQNYSNMFYTSPHFQEAAEKSSSLAGSLSAQVGRVSVVLTVEEIVE